MRKRRKKILREKENEKEKTKAVRVSVPSEVGAWWHQLKDLARCTLDVMAACGHTE